MMHLISNKGNSYKQLTTGSPSSIPVFIPLEGEPVVSRRTPVFNPLTYRLLRPGGLKSMLRLACICCFWPGAVPLLRAENTPEQAQPPQRELSVDQERLAVDTLSLYETAPAGELPAPGPDERDEPGMIRDDPVRPEMAEDPVLAEGDSIELVVFEDPEFNGVYQVRSGGYVFLPQVGSFKVGDMTASQVEAALTERLERDLLRKATVSIIPTKHGAPADAGGVIYVVGEVERPGVLRIPPNETLTMLTAIIRAGGIGPHGDPARVQLARLKGGRREISIMHFDAVLAGMEAGTELALQHGDIINVIGRGGLSLHRAPPPKRGTVYLSGQVKNPGPHPIQDLTVYQTILRNGGLDRFANLKRTYVLRVDHATGRQMKIPINLHDIIKRGEMEKDIPVEPGDIIVVPERFFSF